MCSFGNECYMLPLLSDKVNGAMIIKSGAINTIAHVSIINNDYFYLQSTQSK